jgi:streptogramin lyase
MTTRFPGNKALIPQKIGSVPFLAPSNSLPELVHDSRLDRMVCYQSMFSAHKNEPPALVRNDFETHSQASFPQPMGRGSWQIRQLSDTKLWFGMNGPGQLACFDPVSEKFENLPSYEPTRPVSHLTDVVEGPDNRLYMPGYPSGDLVAFDRSSGVYQEYPLVDTNHQLYAACVTDNGHIGVLNGLQHNVYRFDPQTESSSLQSPVHLQGRANAYSRFTRCGDYFLVRVGYPEGGIEICCFAADDLQFLRSFVITPPVISGANIMTDPEGEPFLTVDQGRIYHLDLERGSCEPAYVLPGVPSRGISYFLDSERILFAGHSQYYGIYHIPSDDFDLRRTEIQNPPVGIFSILPTSSGDLYCSAELGLTLTRISSGGSSEVLGLAHSGSGEIYGSAEACGRIYSVSYTHAILTVYDPALPWLPGDAAGSNPRSLGTLGEDQYRPVTGIVNGPGNRLYVGTLPGYGAKGGALTIVDPGNNTLRSHRHLVKDHSVLGLTVDETRVYVGTSVIADGYIEPASGDAHLLVFDPQPEEVVDSYAVAGARSITTMGNRSGKVFFWSDDHDGGTRCFIYDAGVNAIRQFDHGLGDGRTHNRPMVVDDTGVLYFVHRNRIVRLDPKTEVCEIIHTASSPPILACRGSLLFFSHEDELWSLPV